ncbi:AfsR/SARP family transcriptional regulator [Actinophytocola sp.]|uniref:AfsR/SARP family transcriptional regulator n=1 Tax=Actinophytocola sp. TaxID=1872138 RepID=UPI002F94270F
MIVEHGKELAALHSAPYPRFCILGPVDVEGPDGPVRIPPGRQQVILAFLLLEANQVVSIDNLVDALWDENPPNTARTQVQISVSRLRKNLAGAGVSVAIETKPPGYVLRVSGGNLDAHVFTTTVAEARAIAMEGRTAEAANMLRAAAALWRGACLDGLPSRALRTRALRLDEERLSAIEDYLELELHLGRHRRLVGEITHLTHQNPLRERLRALLMIALYRSGRQAEALDVYREGREMLVDELGLEPGPELRLLENAIFAGDESLPFTRTAPVAAPPLRDPEPVPPVSRVTCPHQLPADTADFVGHEAVLDAAEAVLTGDRRAVGIVVVTGRPGVGKSTVAAHLAHRVATGHFPDGQLYCDLRGTRAEPSAAFDVLGRFLGALGIPGPAIPADLDGRSDMYRTVLTERRVLVVLDDATSERQVLPLLPGSSTCAVIVTSRARLTGVPGAHRVDLPVLDVDQSLALFAAVLGEDRVNAESAPAEALVATVGGLPLAVRIIAARLAARPHWTLASMVHRLASERHRLDELAHGEMTIRASLSLTHDGLDDRSRELFALLSQFEGPTLPGWLAGAVLDDDRRFPSDLLEPLVDVQMLEVSSVAPTGEFRYRFQDMLRLFAREKAETDIPPDRRVRAVARVVGGWLALTEEAHRRVYGGDFTVLHGDGARWRPHPEYVDQAMTDPLDWMEGERENLCMAVGQAVDAGLHEVGWDLAVTVATLCELRGHLDEWHQTHQVALTATRAAGDVRGTAALLGSLGTLYLTWGQYRRAHETLGAALAEFVTLDEPRGAGLCRRDLALLARYAGDDELALSLYEQAIGDFGRVDDVVGRATVLTQRAYILCLQNEFGSARADLAEALEINRGVGYAGGVARALRRLGQVQFRSGAHPDAERTFTEVLAMVRRSRDVIGEGHLLFNLGEVTAAAGRLDLASRWFEKALEIRETIMDRHGCAVVRTALADVLMRTGQRRRAAELLEQAVAVFAERGMDRERAAADRMFAVITGNQAGNTP